MTTVDRPLSPHLQVYRWQITMALSILHRLTGVALAVGAVGFVLWLWLLAFMPGAFVSFNELLATIVGQLMLCGWTFALFYHMANGVRHLWWDVGRGLDNRAITIGGVTVIVVATVFTGVTWFILLTGV